MISVAIVTAAFLAPYIYRISTIINTIPTNAATNAPISAFSHNVALIFSSCFTINAAGSAPSLSPSTNVFAQAASNDPSICAVPPHILSWIVGAVTSSPQTKIAICFPIACSVMLQNTSFPVSSKFTRTTGFPS